MARVVNLICPTAKAKYFSQRGWTGTKQRNEVICPSGKIIVFESVIARSDSDEAIHLPCGSMDCFAEPVIGRRFAPTRWLAMTGNTVASA
jgi:hypothetical protein